MSKLNRALLNHKSITIGAMYNGFALVNADGQKKIVEKQVSVQELFPEQTSAWAKDIVDFADKVEERNK